MTATRRTQVLLIGGRSGVGKTTVSYEVSQLLREQDIAHALVDGDNLDAVYPPVEGSALMEANLAAIWRSYQGLGQSRLIFVNTVSVLEDDVIRRAVGGDATVTGVLLQCSDAAARERLARREIGSTLGIHLDRSARAAAHLERMAGEGIHRVGTTDRSVRDIATSIVRLSGWAEPIMA